MCYGLMDHELLKPTRLRHWSSPANCIFSSINELHFLYIHSSNNSFRHKRCSVCYVPVFRFLLWFNMLNLSEWDKGYIVHKYCNFRLNIPKIKIRISYRSIVYPYTKRSPRDSIISMQMLGTKCWCKSTNYYYVLYCRIIYTCKLINRLKWNISKWCLSYK